MCLRAPPVDAVDYLIRLVEEASIVAAAAQFVELCDTFVLLSGAP